MKLGDHVTNSPIVTIHFELMIYNITCQLSHVNWQMLLWTPNHTPVDWWPYIAWRFGNCRQGWPEEKETKKGHARGWAAQPQGACTPLLCHQCHCKLWFGATELLVHGCGYLLLSVVQTCPRTFYTCSTLYLFKFFGNFLCLVPVVITTKWQAIVWFQ